MSNQNITENNHLLSKTCSILLTVIFFILSFLTGFNNIAIFVLGILTLGITILLSYKSLKGISIYTLGIILIPLLSYGVIMSLSYFSGSLYSLTTRIFLTFNILLFVIAGYFSRKIEGFSFKWIFIGIFLSLSIISLINVIFTSVYYGPFYGFRLTNYYSYYDGVSSRFNVGSSAYALCGFAVKEVPIEYYLLYPFLLLTSIPFYLLSDRGNKFNIITSCCFVLVALISLFFVISKISLIYILVYLVFICLVSLIIVYRKLYGKPLRYTLYGLGILVFIFGFLLFLNAQLSLTGIRNLFASNRLFNYLFNTNRFSENALILLNGVFSKEKMIGFPVYFDYQYGNWCLPTNNILINQFMYGGIFGFIFFLVIIGLFVYLFIKLRKVSLEDKNYKYFPILFVIAYFVTTMIIDQNSYDHFDYGLVFANFLSPFFYISLFVFGHYYSLISMEEVKNEA